MVRPLGKRSLFRQTALDQLDHPHQLDLVAQIIPMRLSFAIIGIALLMIGLTLWAVFGRVAFTVDGRGLLTSNPDQPGSSTVVLSPVDGQLTAWQVGVTDNVQAGQVVALITIADESTVEVHSLYAGKVARLNVELEASVSAGKSIDRKSVV